MQNVFAISILCISICVSLVHGIMGGHKIRIEDAPYHVGYGEQCGGVLVQKMWALTCAHCGTEDFIRVGSNIYLKGTEISITKHIVHPNFGKQHQFDFDVQLLRLRRPLHLTKTISGIGIRDRKVDVMNIVLVSGWGYEKEWGDYSTILQQVEVQVYSFNKCQMFNNSWYNYTLTLSMFCATGQGKRDACQGDSGGGVVMEGELVGLSSFGYGCGRVPGVYTDLTHMLIRGWIKQNTGV